MLKYLIIHLDNTSVSFCHYINPKTERKLIDLKTLKEALLWSMKENLMVQIVYPDYEIPREYKDLIDTVEHADVVSSKNPDTILRENADVVIFHSPLNLAGYDFIPEQAYVLRTSLRDLFEHYRFIGESIPHVNKLNVVVTDIENFQKENHVMYETILEHFIQIVQEEYRRDHSVLFNLLTDRIFLFDKMNNCNAGDEHVTLAPDGKFYVCPAFYLDKEDSYNIGNVKGGLEIKNPQLYKLSHAPICRTCDAYQCKRCVWLNRKFTLEVNTPSHEQCVMAHLERNASRTLLKDLYKLGTFRVGTEIKEIDYLDPFDKLTEKY